MPINNIANDNRVNKPVIFHEMNIFTVFKWLAYTVLHGPIKTKSNKIATITQLKLNLHNKQKFQKLLAMLMALEYFVCVGRYRP